MCRCYTLEGLTELSCVVFCPKILFSRGFLIASISLLLICPGFQSSLSVSISSITLQICPFLLGYCIYWHISIHSSLLFSEFFFPTDIWFCLFFLWLLKVRDRIILALSCFLSSFILLYTYLLVPLLLYLISLAVLSFSFISKYFFYFHFLINPVVFQKCAVQSQYSGHFPCFVFVVDS